MAETVQTDQLDNSDVVQRRTNWLRELTQHPAVSLTAILLLMWIILSRLSPYFFSLDNVLQITLQAAVVAMIAAGETFVILSGGIDLSVGSIFAMSAMTAGLVMQAKMPIPIVLAVGLLTGAVCGLANGWGVSKLQLPPFIVTLGTMSILRGFALLINKGIPIFGANPDFAFLGQGRVFDLIPVPSLVVLGVYILCWFILRQTPFGRFTYAVGSNPEAARLAGVGMSRQIISIYVLCGVLAGLAGMTEASRLSSAQPAGGVGLELDAIGAVVIGGTSLFGGEGNIVATLIGALMIATIRNGLNIVGIEAFWQNVVTGFIIILAVYLDRLRRLHGAA
ncbi:MAG: ABC transporter permease [Chloroflexota bacterium]